MPYPNFYLVGVPKAGTTSFYYYLKQHPDVFLSDVKEPNFFSRYPRSSSLVKPGCGPGDDLTTVWMNDEKAYLRLFRRWSPAKIIGEGSLSYLYSETAAENIFGKVPNAKILVILRNPVDRAFSHYLHMVRDNRETLTFRAALDQEDVRIKRGWEFSWHYKNVGLYYKQLARYANVFCEDNIAVMFYQDFVDNPVSFMRGVFRFLNISPDFMAKMSIRHNPSGYPRFRWVNAFCSKPNPIKSLAKAVIPHDVGHNIKERLMAANLRAKPKMSISDRRHLIEFFYDDVRQLQRYVGRDLSGWLTCDD